MKQTFKLLKALSLVIILTFISCGNDDDANQTNVISLQDLTVTIDENPTNGQVVGIVEATQTVGGATLVYSITVQTPTGALTIDASTGELTVADATLFDFETNPVITAIIEVDGAVNTAMVNITIANVTELSAQDLTVSIDENPTNGNVVGTVQATGDGTLTYSITTQTPAGALSINSTTGELVVTDATIFDFETNPTIVADILVDNSGTTETVTVTINLNNVNELSVQDFTISIDENPMGGDVIGTVLATGDGTLSFNIDSQTPNENFLSIDAATGELTVDDEPLFDFEIYPTITAIVSVSNTVSTEMATVTINLNNINELGDYNHGGIIFWIDPADNSHGLVCALDNQMSAAWGCSGFTTGATGTAIGTGEANTLAIVSTCAVPGIAADIANDPINGYNDWYLPSLDEFNEISVNYQAYIWPTIQANGGSALFGTVWTSTEANSNNAYIAFLGGSSPVALPKDVANINILPIRSF